LDQTFDVDGVRKHFFGDESQKESPGVLQFKLRCGCPLPFFGANHSHYNQNQIKKLKLIS